MRSLRRKLALALALVLGAAGCSARPTPPRTDVGPSSPSSTTLGLVPSAPTAPTAAASAAALPTAAPTATAAATGPGPGPTPSDAVRGNELAARFYREVVKTAGGNVFLAPPSIRLALGMAYVGAEGATASEIASALGFEPDRAAVAGSAKRELEGWSKLGGADVELHVVNRLWGDRSTAFLPEFVALNREGWGAGLESLDFRKAPELGRKSINDWVGEQTKGRIAELLPVGSVTRDTRLLITNAVYFDATWRSPFEARKTAPGPFFVGGKASSRELPLMHQRHAFAFAEADGAKLVLLPYGAGPLGMVVVLPDARDGLGSLEASLSAERFASWGRALGERTAFVDLALPKFQLRFGGSMRPVLEALGMKRAFSNAAELGGVAGGPELKITDVIHRTFVRVDERGTEAAAATGVPMGLKSMPPPPTLMLVDHPFLYYLWDTSAGRVLFVGRVVDPGAK
jgi:serpin B